MLLQREQQAARGLREISASDVASNPEASAARGLEMLDDAERILVHFDIDTVDYMDLPISDNAGRNEGLAFDTAMRALRVLLTTSKLGALTLTEVNPDHDPDGSAARRLADGLAAALSTAEERT